MQISEKVARLKSDFDGVYKSGMENSENYKAGYAEAEAITISIIDRSLTECVIPEGTTSVGAHAFAYCNNLARVSIPEGVERIGASAFQGAVLTELVLPLSCKYIDSWGLNSMNKLQSIIFGDLTYMGPNGAGNNFKCMLYDFTRCTTVPELNHTNAFTGINANAKMLVPAALYYDWIEATNWATYADYIVPDGLVPSRGLEYSFDGWNYQVIGRGSCLDSIIVIPETYNDGINGEHAVKYISGYTTEDYEIIGAFLNDQTIEEIILPESGVSIDRCAFTGSSLKVVRNYWGGVSFWSDGLALEYVSFIDGIGVNNFDFVAAYVKTLDFSRHTTVPTLGDVIYLNAHPDLKILVPIDLYDEWIVSTNWTEYAEYIVAVK